MYNDPSIAVPTMLPIAIGLRYRHGRQEQNPSAAWCLLPVDQGLSNLSPVFGSDVQSSLTCRGQDHPRSLHQSASRQYAPHNKTHEHVAKSPMSRIGIDRNPHPTASFHAVRSKRPRLDTARMERVWRKGASTWKITRCRHQPSMAIIRRPSLYVL